MSHDEEDDAPREVHKASGNELLYGIFVVAVVLALLYVLPGCAGQVSARIDQSAAAPAQSTRCIWIFQGDRGYTPAEWEARNGQ
jgi:hypothetical protein